MNIKARNRIIVVAVIAVILLGVALASVLSKAQSQYIYADNWTAPAAPTWADDTPSGIIGNVDDATKMQVIFMKQGIRELVNGDGELDFLDWERFDAMAVFLVEDDPNTNAMFGYNKTENVLYTYEAAENLSAEEHISAMSRMMMRALFSQAGDSIFSVGLADYLTAHIVEELGTWLGYANSDCALTAGFLYGMYGADVKSVINGSIIGKIDADTRPGMGEKLAAATYVLYAGESKFTETEIAAARLVRIEIMSYITKSRIAKQSQYADMIRMAMDVQLIQEALTGDMSEAELQYFASIYGGNAELAINLIPTPPEIPNNSDLFNAPSIDWGYSLCFIFEFLADLLELLGGEL